MARIIGWAAVCLAAVGAGAAEETAWKPWEHRVTAGGLAAFSQTFQGGSSAFGYVVDYELSLPRCFSLFANYRAVNYESDGWDYTMTTVLETEGTLDGLTFGGRYTPGLSLQRIRPYVEAGFGLWNLEEDDYRNFVFDDHNKYDANAILLGGGARVRIFDLPLDLVASATLAYLWWDDDLTGGDDDLYIAFGLGLSAKFPLRD